MLIDTISLTMWANVAFATAWIAGLMDVERGEFEESGMGTRGYRDIRRGPLGAQVWHGVRQADQEERCTLSMQSKAMECVALRDVVEGVVALSAAGIRWQVSRVDVALDHLQVTPAAVRDLVESGAAFRCRVRRGPDGRRYYSWHYSAEGDTVYLGSRTSLRFLRVYNLRGFTRAELECKDESAVGVLAQLMVTAEEGWAQLLRGVLLDFVDFGTAWWDVAMCGSVRIKLPWKRSADLNAEERAAWLDRYVAPSLAKHVEAAGGDLGALDSLFHSGRRRLESRRRRH